MLAVKSFNPIADQINAIKGLGVPERNALRDWVFYTWAVTNRPSLNRDIIRRQSADAENRLKKWDILPLEELKKHKICLD